MAGKKKDKDFGEVISELEGLVTAIEDENCSLDDALKTFESGIALVRDAQKRLAEVEQKVQVLSASGQTEEQASVNDEASE